jgi:hypothetical protein
MIALTAPSWLRRAGDRVNDALRGRTSEVALPTLVAALVGFGLLYGASMGAFTGVWEGQPLQLLYSGLKVPLLLCISFVVALPSFFVLNTLLGVREDFREALRAVAGAQATLTIVLAALAPLTLWFYASTTNYNQAVLWNGLMFLLAAGSAQVALRRSYKPLIQRNGRHRLLMWAWGVCFAFVAVQAAWVLRPFIGKPDEPVQFFRETMWGNAYVEILEKILQAVG